MTSFEHQVAGSSVGIDKPYRCKKGHRVEVEPGGQWIEWPYEIAISMCSVCKCTKLFVCIETNVIAEYDCGQHNLDVVISMAEFTLCVPDESAIAEIGVQQQMLKAAEFLCRSAPSIKEYARSLRQQFSMSLEAANKRVSQAEQDLP